MFGRAIQQAPLDLEQAVDESYLEYASGFEEERHLATLLKFLRPFRHDAIEASQQPVEFGVVTGAIVAILELLFCVPSYYVKSLPRELLQSWCGRALAHAAWAAMSERAMVEHVLK